MRSDGAAPQRHEATGGRGDGPPDLDELWRDFNRKLSGLFSGKGGGPRGNGSGGDGGNNFQPDMTNAGIGVALISGVIALIWLGSGIFIVQEGQQAVIMTFGHYSRTVDAGIKYRCATRRCSRKTRTSSTSASPCSTG